MKQYGEKLIGFSVFDSESSSYNYAWTLNICVQTKADKWQIKMTSVQHAMITLFEPGKFGFISVCQNLCLFLTEENKATSDQVFHNFWLCNTIIILDALKFSIFFCKRHQKLDNWLQYGLVQSPLWNLSLIC